LGLHHFGINSRGGFQILNTQSYAVKDFVIPDSTAFSTYLNSNWDAMSLGDGSFAVTTAAGFYVFDASGKVVLRHDAHDIPGYRSTKNIVWQGYIQCGWRSIPGFLQ
jgi:hypothetical protein